MFNTYQRYFVFVSLLLLSVLITLKGVSAQIYVPLINNGGNISRDASDDQTAEIETLVQAESMAIAAAETAKGKRLDTRPVWEITFPGTDHSVAWVDHRPNSRFAIWDMGTSDERDDAVLDKETGLVWERAPHAATTDWFSAQVVCMEKTTGGRMGWRLPTIEELLTLPDPASTAQLWLPDGHPFYEPHFIRGDPYWSATSSIETDPGRQNRAHTMVLNNWDNLPFPDRFGTLEKGENAGYLCVRGGSGQALQHVLSGGT